MKYVYPAIFTPEEDGGYSVLFTDFESCYTCGDTLEEAMEMAEDVLALTLYGYEDEQKAIPLPSSMANIDCPNGSFPSLVHCDTLEYRKRFSSKAVKKTLTIPEWMNDEATKLNINFSQLLQDAIVQKIQTRS